MSQLGILARNLNTVLRATLPQVKKGFDANQPTREYVGWTDFVEGASTPCSFSTGEWGWSVQARWARGTVRAVRSFQKQSYLKTNTIERLKRPFVIKGEFSMSFDLYEMKASENDPEKLYDIVDDQYNQARIGIAEDGERMIFGQRASSTDDDNWDSLQEIFPLSQTAGGVCTIDPVGGFNGVYHTFADTTRSSTYGGADRSLLANELLRPWVATHGGIWGETLIGSISNGLLDMRFRRLSQLKGDLDTGGDMKIYCGDSMFQQAKSDVNNGPDDKQGDARRFTRPMVEGAELVPVSMIDEVDPLNSIYILRRGGQSGVRFLKPTGCWMNEMDDRVEGAPHVRNKALHYTGQMVARNPRMAGGRIHAEF
jgi:hypothetical protein